MESFTVPSFTVGVSLSLNDDLIAFLAGLRVKQAIVSTLQCDPLPEHSLKISTFLKLQTVVVFFGATLQLHRSVHTSLYTLPRHETREKG